MTNAGLHEQGVLSLKTLSATTRAHLRRIAVSGPARTVVRGDWSAMTTLSRIRLSRQLAVLVVSTAPRISFLPDRIGEIV